MKERVGWLFWDSAEILKMLGGWGMLPRPTGKGSSSDNGIREKEAWAACLLDSGLTKGPGLVCVWAVGGANSGPSVPRQTEVKRMFHHIAFTFGDKQLQESQSSFITRIYRYVGLICFFLIEWCHSVDLLYTLATKHTCTSRMEDGAEVPKALDWRDTMNKYLVHGYQYGCIPNSAICGVLLVP